MTNPYETSAHSFATSRKGMKWAEIDYLFDTYIDCRHNRQNNVEDVDNGSILRDNYVEVRQNNVEHVEVQKMCTPKILDVGCGGWRLYEYIVDRMFDTKYMGVDNSKNLIEYCKEKFPDGNFRHHDMTQLSTMSNIEKYDHIVFLASFHHVDNVDNRLSTLCQLSDLLSEQGRVYMTNWHLLSLINKRYEDSKIADYPDGSADFMIKLGEGKRFYHSFSLQELDVLVEKSGFKMLENRVFEWERNIVTVFEKKPKNKQ